MNHEVWLLMNSSVSQRRAAKLLGTIRTTIVRKQHFVAEQATLRHEDYLESLLAEGKKITRIQFDEMESFERSKCLLVSIPIVVLPETRKILAFGVCTMPAKGPLAEISRKKYGFRKDERAAEAARVFARISKYLDIQNLTIVFDENPKYPGWIRRPFPKAKHVIFKGRRGCVVGQGELKSGGFDPLFDLNHTCAMLQLPLPARFQPGSL